MVSNTTDGLDPVLGPLVHCTNVSHDLIQSLSILVSESHQQKSCREPIPWTGVYIALASLVCVCALVTDFVYGIVKSKWWFPCIFSKLNAASLATIGVAMKIPTDLCNPMPGDVDQYAMIGSMAFMCTIMANLLPSLATMDNNALLSNMTGLVIQVLSFVFNVCIQINKGAISPNSEEMQNSDIYVGLHKFAYSNRSIAIVYVAMLLMLLMIHICSAFMIVTSKSLSESKYLDAHQKFMGAQRHLYSETHLDMALKQHVKAYWIMAKSGSPELLTICSVTTLASGVLCVSNFVIHVLNILNNGMPLRDHQSDYKWSISAILIIQTAGVILGTCVPIARCFATSSFKLSNLWLLNNMNVFNVERYWTQKLSDWEQSGKLSLSSSSLLINVLQKLCVFKLLIAFQWVIVIISKTIGIIVTFLFISVFCIVKPKQQNTSNLPVRTREQDRTSNLLVRTRGQDRIFGFLDNDLGNLLVREPQQDNTRIPSDRAPQQPVPTPEQDLKSNRNYVLQVRDDMELSDTALKRILKSVDDLITKSEKKAPKNLMDLLDQGSIDFIGVQKFDNNYGEHKLIVTPASCWSLPLVTLTAIAISLSDTAFRPRGTTVRSPSAPISPPRPAEHPPRIAVRPALEAVIPDRTFVIPPCEAIVPARTGIQKKIDIKSLVSGVNEGLVYVAHVEQSLNDTQEHIKVQKRSEILWLEVVSHRWLGEKLKNDTNKAKTAKEILEWLRDTAEGKVEEFKNSDIGGPNDKLNHTSTCAYSMYRITQIILLCCNDQVTHEQLFVHISIIISDILAACLTNLKQVIVLKCYTNVIEEREASIHAAAELLGETTQIINSLIDRQLPALSKDDLPFFDNWVYRLRYGYLEDEA